MKFIRTFQLHLWHVVFPLLILANVGYVWHNVIGWLLTLGFFLVVPGYLLIRALRIKLPFSWAILGLSIGLSVSVMLVFGLILNCMHYFGLSQPLQTPYVFAVLDVASLILIFATRTLDYSFPSISMKLRWEPILFGILFTLLPILSVAGAIRLNNGASNILTMMMLGLIGILFLALILRPEQRGLFPYAIFMTALAVLFSTSLRGWLITGHDIHHEFGVFQTTAKHSFWQARTSQGDPYNACLSITILPTLIYKMTLISPAYIYKAVFQIIFAFATSTLYIFASRFAIRKQAFIGVFAFIFYPTFIKDLPFLNRQEIAFMFFILLLHVNFLNITNKAKSFLSAILLLSLILSHYSSSYATIMVLILAFGIFKVLYRSKIKSQQSRIPLLSLPLLMAALLVVFIWNVQITASSANLSNTIASTVKNIVAPSDDYSSKYSLFSTQKVLSVREKFTQYAVSKHTSAQLLPVTVQPLTSIGRLISRFYNVFLFNDLIHNLTAKLLQVLVVFGTILLWKRQRKSETTITNAYFLAIAVSFVVVLALFTIFPLLSVNYDVTRLLQQSMSILWLPAVLTGNFMFGFLRKRAFIATTVLFIILFFHLSGFQSQLTGGYLPTLDLNNSGSYYDFFYTHYSDQLGSEWLANNRMTFLTVFQDTNTAMPPTDYGIATGISNGQTQGYYYLDNFNTSSGSYRTFVAGLVEYKNPNFIDGKGRIYTNGSSQIYYRIGP